MKKTYILLPLAFCLLVLCLPVIPVNAEYDGTITLNFTEFIDQMEAANQAEETPYGAAGKARLKSNEFSSMSIKVVKVEDGAETTCWEANITTLENISIALDPGTYKVYTQLEGDDTVLEYNNESEGYVISPQSHLVIPMAYPPWHMYILDAPWRIENSENNIPILAVVTGTDWADIYNITVHDHNDGDRFVASTNWNYTQPIYWGEPFFHLFNINKGSFVQVDGKVSVIIKFELHLSPDILKGPVNVKVSQYDVPTKEDWYCGDTHQHTNYTDNLVELGAPIYATRAANKALGLDWMIVTDHSFDLNPDKWNVSSADCDTHSDNVFRVMQGEEVSCYLPTFLQYYHLLVYDCNFIPGGEWEDGSIWDYTPAQVIDIANNQGGITYAAHPMYNDGVRPPWRDEDYNLPFTGLQIWNYASDEPSHLPDGLAKWNKSLLKGRHVYIEGGTDAHGDFNTCAGKVKTYVYAQGYSQSNLPPRSEILDALRNGHSIMTDGPLVAFTVNNEHGETAIIGNETAGEELTLSIQWESTSEFGKVSNIYVHRGIIGGTENEIYHLTPNTLSGTEIYSDLASKLTESQTAYIRLSATTDKNYRAYTNPIWIEKVIKYLHTLASMDKEVYSPSELAKLTVTLTDDDSNPVEGASVSYLIKNSEAVTVKSGSCSDKGSGTYEAQFNVPATTGSYTVEVTATKSGFLDGFASTSFTVMREAEGHNLKLTVLELSTNKAKPGGSVAISGQVDNIGGYTEDVKVDILISGPDYSLSESGISLGSLAPDTGTGIEEIYTWHIPENAKTGYYSIKVTAWSPSGDEDYSDNSRTSSIYVSEGDAPSYKAYYYEWRYVDWNEGADYTDFGWPLGAFGPINFHGYTIAIPGVEGYSFNEYIDDPYKNGKFWIYIEKDGTVIETPDNYWDPDSGYNNCLSQYFDDNKLLLSIMGGIYKEKLWIKVGYPTISASLDPEYHSTVVNQDVAYNVEFPYCDWTPKVHKCTGDNQPKIYNKEYYNYFEIDPESDSTDFTITATPPQSGRYKFAVDTNGPGLSGGEYVSNYIVFGELQVNDFYDVRLSSITATPPQPKVGDEVTITNKVENIGSAALTGIDIYTTVYDSMGKAVKTFHKTANAGDVSFSWDTSEFTSGDYTIISSISHPQDMDSSNNEQNKNIVLLPPPSLTVTASIDNSSYKLTEEVIFNATVRDSDTLAEISDVSVKATITKPDSSVELVILSYSSDKYTATYLPDQIGNYAVTVSASKTGYKTGEGQLSFGVEDQPTYLDVVPNSWRMNTNEEKQFTANLYWVSGTIENVTSKASWTTDNTSVLENMGGGKFKAKSVGFATVTATYEEKSDNSEVVVEKLVYGINLTVNTKEKTTTPNINATYVLTVINTGSGADSYTLTVDNMDNAAVASLNQTTVADLASGSSATVLLNVADESEGTYNVSVTATSQGDPSVNETVITTATVEGTPRYGVNLSCDDPEKYILPGDSVIYNITVTNTGNTQDTIEFTLPLPPLPPSRSSWTYSFSGPTSVELASGESMTVTLTVSCSLDVAIGSQYSVPLIGTSQSDSSKSDSVTTTTTATSSKILNADVLRKATTPNVNATYVLTVTNVRSVADSYALSVDNVDNAVVASLSQTVVSNLQPESSALVLLNVADETNGTYNVSVTATSQGDPSITDTITGTTTVGVFGVDLSCDDPEKYILPGDSVIYNITVTNTGNTQDTIEFTLPLPPSPPSRSSWTYSFSGPTSVELASGESMTVTLTVSCSLDVAIGSQYSVPLIGTSQSDSSKSDSVMTKTTGVEDFPPQIVSYTISNRTITPPQTTSIDVEFSEEVDYTIVIEKDSTVVYDWTGTATNPTPKVWEGTYEVNSTVVPDGDYIVNVTGTSTAIGLSVGNNTEKITVTSATTDLIMADAKLIETIHTGSAVDLSAIIDDGDFNATVEGDYVVWDEKFDDYIYKGETYHGVAGYTKSPMIIRIAVSDDGTFYLGTCNGTPNDNLLIFSQKQGVANYYDFSYDFLEQSRYGEPHDVYLELDARQNYLAFIFAEVYKDLYAKGYIESGPTDYYELYNCNYTLKNRFNRTITVIRSFICHQQFDYSWYPERRRPVEEARNAKWSPIADYPDQNTDLSRSFDINYHSASESFVWIHAFSDNSMHSDTTIYGMDTPPDYSCSGGSGSRTWSVTYNSDAETYNVHNDNCGYAELFLNNQRPNKVLIEAYTTWSFLYPDITIAVFGNITTSNHTESPSPGDDNNPEPLKWVILPSGQAKQQPTAIIDSITPNPAEQGTETISFSGHGTDADGSVLAYNWRSSIDGQLSTSVSFTKPAAEFSEGTHTIYFKVQDNDAMWSIEDVGELTINPPKNPPSGYLDARSGTYPSISGTHTGTIIPSFDINVSKMYTYPCPGTGGHAEYVRIYNASGTLAEAHWNGYVSDWHNLSFNTSFTLYENETYNYTIVTGSYPQIIHAQSHNATGGVITCTSFEDANGNVHTNWIPAIKLY